MAGAIVSEIGSEAVQAHDLPAIARSQIDLPDAARLAFRNPNRFFGVEDDPRGHLPPVRIGKFGRCALGRPRPYVAGLPRIPARRLDDGDPESLVSDIGRRDSAPGAHREAEGA